MHVKLVSSEGKKWADLYSYANIMEVLREVGQWRNVYTYRSRITYFYPRNQRLTRLNS